MPVIVPLLCWVRSDRRGCPPGRGCKSTWRRRRTVRPARAARDMQGALPREPWQRRFPPCCLLGGILPRKPMWARRCPHIEHRPPGKYLLSGPVGRLPDGGAELRQGAFRVYQGDGLRPAAEERQDSRRGGAAGPREAAMAAARPARVTSSAPRRGPGQKVDDAVATYLSTPLIRW
jgi:hypothetical protein